MTIASQALACFNSYLLHQFQWLVVVFIVIVAVHKPFLLKPEVIACVCACVCVLSCVCACMFRKALENQLSVNSDVNNNNTCTTTVGQVVSETIVRRKIATTVNYFCSSSDLTKVRAQVSNTTSNNRPITKQPQKNNKGLLLV